MKQSNAEMKQMLVQNIEDVSHYEMEGILRIIGIELERKLNEADREERMTITAMGLYNFIDEWVMDKLDKVIENWNDKYRYSASVFIQRTPENTDRYKIGLNVDMDWRMGMHRFELDQELRRDDFHIDEYVMTDNGPAFERPSMNDFEWLPSPRVMHRPVATRHSIAVDAGHSNPVQTHRPEPDIQHIRAPEVEPRENIHRRNLERYRESSMLPQDAATRAFRRILEGRL